MFFIKGTRTVRIKSYAVNHRQCDNCKDFDLTVNIYGSYYHVWFIPIVSIGVKSTKIYCHNCSSFVRIDSLAKEYEAKARTPFYLYTGVILAGLTILSAVGLSLWGSHERAGYVAKPQPGDVYLVKNKPPESETYYFLKVIRVSGDSVITYSNHGSYSTSPSQLAPEDYFSTSHEIVYTKQQVAEMYDKDFIVTIFRDYGSSAGFGRLSSE